MDPEESLVSFDVSSLFTNVPIKEAVDVLHGRLQEDSTLEARTDLLPGSTAELLQFCLKSTYFCFNGVFYEHCGGAAPVLAVVANMYMEHFESLPLGTVPIRPRLWKRYVDNTLCESEGVGGLPLHLNSIRPSIKFTVQVEQSGTHPFLDVLVQRKEDDCLDVHSLSRTSM